MKIETIKSNLRNIVLLAKEHKEKIPDSVNIEIAEMETAIRNGNGLNQYERRYYRTLKQEKHKAERDISQQLIYFVEATLCEFTKPGACSYILEFDDEKIDEARKNLSQEEINLLGELYELHCNLEELECYKKGVYRYSEVKELKPEINKLVDRAFISNA